MSGDLEHRVRILEGKAESHESWLGTLTNETLKMKEAMKLKEAIEIEYGCGHKTTGALLLNCGSLSVSAYYEWAESVGINGDKSQCFDCWCKAKGE